MPRPLKRQPWTGRGRQCGQSLLILLAILAAGVIAVFYTSVRPASSSIDRDKLTAAALAQAKEALLGRAWSDGTRPGSLPCPDVDNDGILTLGVDYGGGGVCTSNIGRLPWKTLGLADPRDSSGERLWYALSPNFQDATGSIINSDTKGQLTVTGASPALEVVAILFAPGETIGAQARGTAVEQNNVANYLEGGNEDLDSTFTTATASGTFNDRLLVVTAADVITVVEKRVAREMLALLTSYRSAATGSSPRCNCYTWADEDFNNEGDNDAFRGWLPLGEGDPHIWGPPPADYAVSPVNLGISIPAWLANNDWWKVVYYAVAPNETQNKSGGTLTVDGVSGTQVVLITPGPAAPGVPRPVNAPGTPAYWAEYLNDAQNSDHANNTYVTPSSTAYARNRLYKIP